MILTRILPLFLPVPLCLAIVDALVNATPARAIAPSGQTWLTIQTPHFRIHHTPPLEAYARSVARTMERVLPEIERRMSWKAPDEIDVIVEDPFDAANGLTMNFPNNSIELYASPFASDSTLGYYQNWSNEIATHELTHMVANDTTLGAYKFFRSIFGSWVKPNGVQPVWIMEGLAVYDETSLTNGGRGRSPLVEAILREAVLKNKLDSSDYTSLDRFNDGVPWWPAGNTPYFMGYTIQALPTKQTPNLPGKLSYENASTMIFAPDRTLRAVNGRSWADVWGGATRRLSERYGRPAGEKLNCQLTDTGGFTGGQAVSADGWIYFSEEDWDRGYHLARVRADAPCGQAEVERLERKKYSGPTQVAVSPSGSTVAYSALDPGFETEYADLYLWREHGGRERLTTDERVREPAFLDDDHLLYVRVNADTSETVVTRDLRSNTENKLFTAKPLEQISGLFALGKHVLFSFHANDGHQKIVQLVNGQPRNLVKTMDKDREFERNPFLTREGELYFAAAYGHGPQEIYRFDPGSGGAVAVLGVESGFADRPVLLADGKSFVIQSYGLHGMDLFRVAAPGPGGHPGPAPEPDQDLHQFLTGEAPRSIAGGENIPIPQSVPYSLGTSATSLWPHYWFPQGSFAQNGVLLGASTSGNDALNYHRWAASADWDSRANFPVFDAYYTNRIYKTSFRVEAQQTNNYFVSERSSNRNTMYSAEADIPAWDFIFGFGAAYRQKVLFGAQTNSGLAYQSIFLDRSGATGAAVAPNWGWTFSNFTSGYPSTPLEGSFVTVQPQLTVYTSGLWPSHSISFNVAAGIGTNKFLASNYFLGGGASPLTSSPYIVRGYPTDALFGEKIMTGNLAYTLPLADVYHGIGDNPFFLTDFGLRFMGDVGSASHTAVYSGGVFQGYIPYQALGKTVLYGAGADLITNADLFYHVPVSFTMGGHYGFQAQYGGGWLAYLALSVNMGASPLRSPGQPARATP